MRRRLALVLALFVAACAEFPALDDAVDPSVRGTGFPDIVPLGPILAEADAFSALATGPLPGASLEARAAALRARAARLRGAVIERTVRSRMQGGVDTSALQ